MESIAATLLALVGSYGVVVLLAVFVLEGALVGKLIPTRTLFVAVVIAVGSDALAFLPVVAAAVVGATIGQCLLFVSIRRYGVDPTEVDLIPVTEERLDGADRWFDRWGLPAVAVTNALPGVRGWLALPTATSSVSTPRFAVASLTGTAAYAGGLVVLAVLLDGAITTLAGGALAFA